MHEERKQEELDLTKDHVSRSQITDLLSTIRPRKLFYYQRAFVHRSLIRDANRQKRKGVKIKKYMEKSNETLEYLGDSIFNAIVSQYLFKHYPDAEEGFITRIRSKIVRKEGCALFARKLGLGRYILTSPNVKIDLNSDRILEDTFEAFVGAIFLDLNFEFTSAWIVHLIEKYIDFNKISIDTNYKDILLRYTQSKNYALPKYIDISKTSTSSYEYSCRVAVKIIVNEEKDFLVAYGTESNKKKAEQKASENMLIKLNQTDLDKIANRDIHHKKVKVDKRIRLRTEIEELI